MAPVLEAMGIVDTSDQDLGCSRPYAGNGSQSNNATILLSNLFELLDSPVELRGKRVELSQFEVEFSLPEFVQGGHASEFQGIVFVGFAFDVRQSTSVYVG